MKTAKNISPTALFFALAIFVYITPLSDFANIPEPGFIVYGTIFSSNVTTNVRWQISGASSSAAVNSSIIEVNSQKVYIAVIPFETRSVGGISLGTATQNTLPLNSTPTAYTRQATINATNAVMVYTSSGNPNSFTFGPADRGRIERVDLALPPLSPFAQWLAQYNLPADSIPDADPTHKGMTLIQQYIAGLNPNDTNSVFKLTDVHLITPNVVELGWLSASNRLYVVSASPVVTNSSSGSVSITGTVVGTPPTNKVWITNASLQGPFFYRVQVNLPPGP